MTAPKILLDGETVGALDSFEMTDVRAANLRAGMILMDADLGVAEAVIDHRIGAVRGTGSIAFLIEDVTTGRYEQAQIHGNRYVTVAAR